MAILITSVFGIFVGLGSVAVGIEMDGDAEGISCPGAGLGISTEAMFGGAGVAGSAPLDAQLENNSTHRIRTKER